MAIANAHVAYGRYLARFAGERWQRAARARRAPQRPLWASTGTKDPGYSDVLYVEQLIAPGVINTMPEQTLRAFADHGNVALTLDADARRPEASSAPPPRKASTSRRSRAELEHEGVEAFCDSYAQLLSCIEIQARLAGSNPLGVRGLEDCRGALLALGPATGRVIGW